MRHARPALGALLAWIPMACAITGAAAQTTPSGSFAPPYPPSAPSSPASSASPAASASAIAAACGKPWLGARDLYLRGTMNNWSAPDAQRLYWACDHYELVTSLKGEHSFKIADEDWSEDADFGGPADGLALKGPALSQRFADGLHKLLLTRDGERRSLRIEPCPAAPAACSTFAPADAAAASVTDPVALSLRFDSRSTAHKSPFGAQPSKRWIDFTLAALPGVTRAELVIERRRLEGNQELLEYHELARVPLHRVAGARGRDGPDSHDQWRARHRFGAPAVYGYYFVVTIGDRQYVYQNNKDTIFWTRERGSMGIGLVEDKPETTKRIRRFRQTIHSPDFAVPTWARDVIYYYVFPERFRNGDKSNDPQPGQARYHDQGIERHARWTDAPFKPGSGDGSDAVYNNDFFGGDLAGLIEKLDDIRDLGANTLYMTPVFQAASNHKYDTADYKRIDPAFGSNADFERLTREAARRGLRVITDTSLNHVGADSPYFNRFGNYPAGGAFDGGRLNPDSRYASWFKLSPAQQDPDQQYQGWVGIKDLPEIDKSSASFRDFAYRAPDSVTRFWLDKGAAGWRMDVAPWVPDDFWREWRAVVKQQRPDALTVAETWFDASKYFLGDSFDSTMNYIFRNTVLDYAAGGRADRLYQNLELLRESYPPQALFAAMNLLSTHDQPRALHHLGDVEDATLAKRRLMLAMLFQMTYPGAPTIYYGDEVGLSGGEDPYNRATYPWADEGGRPDEALRGEVKRMVALRHQQPVLRHGTLEAPLWLDEHAIVLLRRHGGRSALVALNNADRPLRVEVRLPAVLRRATFVDAWLPTGARPASPLRPTANDRLTIELPALSGRVLVNE